MLLHCFRLDHFRQTSTILTMYKPPPRPHLCRGRQVFLYKRAQIFVADLWGALGGKGLGCFEDISCLTTFADYRVPVVLRELGVLHYSDDLASKVGGKTEGATSPSFSSS